MGQPTPEQCERIEAALGVTGQSQEQREKMLERLEWIFRLSPGQVFGPGVLPGRNIPEYRRLHANLRKAADKLRAAVDDEDLDWWTRPTFDAITSGIDDIAPADNKGGRPINWPRRAAIHKLGEFYCHVTGTEPGLSHDPNNNNKPGGPFFRLVSACLEIFAPELRPSEDEALAGAIRQALEMNVRPTV